MKTMKKRFLAVFALLILVLNFSGCIKFESEKEYNEYMRTEQDSEKRAKAYEAFNKSE